MNIFPTVDESFDALHARYQRPGNGYIVTIVLVRDGGGWDSRFAASEPQSLVLIDALEGGTTLPPRARVSIINITSIPATVPGTRPTVFIVTAEYDASDIASSVGIITVVQHPAAPSSTNFIFYTSHSSGAHLTPLPPSGMVTITVRLLSTAIARPGYTLELVLVRAELGWPSRFAYSGAETFDIAEVV
eukprot:m.97591 g.97591  ORF g.97591 m.97591 type:complete len:189 (-) comp16713_c0_seq1:49-615(-)